MFTPMRVSALVAALAASLSVSTVEPYAQTSPRASVLDESEPPPQARTRPSLKILTDNDFPPFNFVDDEGALAGFNVDLARAVCLETNSACDIQARAWDDLLPALVKGEADAVIAGHAITKRALRQVDFTDRYFHTPARFAVRRDGSNFEATPEGLDGRRIGVAKDSAHEAFARTFFRDSRVESFPSADIARDALIAGKIDALLDDGMSLSFWLAGTSSRACCQFRGGPFFEPRFFGDGMAIAIAKGDHDLRRLLNDALKRVRASGRYEELVQRYFPNRVY